MLAIFSIPLQILHAVEPHLPKNGASAATEIGQRRARHPKAGRCSQYLARWLLIPPPSWY